mgnify:CR=1 FL=1|jgi:hypothetical protein
MGILVERFGERGPDRGDTRARLVWLVWLAAPSVH